jgi:hypothetical protein
MKVLKTWLNGWVTSYRMGEDEKLCCLFGCIGQPDNMKHYVHCTHLFALQRFFCEETSDNPLKRLSLINPTKSSLKINCCTFAGYHAVKAKVRAGSIHINSVCNEQNISYDTYHAPGSVIRSVWSLFAQSFAAEAGELAVPHRSFSLPKFMFFLSNEWKHPVEPERLTNSPTRASTRTQSSATAVNNMINSTYQEEALCDTLRGSSLSPPGQLPISVAPTFSRVAPPSGGFGLHGATNSSGYAPASWVWHPGHPNQLHETQDGNWLSAGSVPHLDAEEKH